MSYILNHPVLVGELLLEHLNLTGVALLIAAAVALPLALLIQAIPWLSTPLLGLLGTLYTIPSLALIILFVPFLGLNATAVIAAMVVYAQVILVRNLTVGLAAISPAVIEAAQGMGMTAWQRWWWIQVPLALPVFLAGLRLATLVEIAIATLGAKFGAGGLGVLLFEGIQTNRFDKIWAGAIAVAALALAFNLGLRTLEQALTRHR
jgi:osmoprotectant transport system permease protein